MIQAYMVSILVCHLGSGCELPHMIGVVPNETMCALVGQEVMPQLISEGAIVYKEGDTFAVHCEPSALEPNDPPAGKIK